jgi:hypothetical protein
MYETPLFVGQGTPSAQGFGREINLKHKRDIEARQDLGALKNSNLKPLHSLLALNADISRLSPQCIVNFGEW